MSFIKSFSILNVVVYLFKLMSTFESSSSLSLCKLQVSSIILYVGCTWQVDQKTNTDRFVQGNT